MKPLYFYNGEIYKIIRNISINYFFTKEGTLIRELLNGWKEHLGADHILKTDTHFLFCETLKEPEWIEIQE
jgi:hypothetical protein